MKVELVGIDKSFGPVHANDDIHLSIPPGTIQGILGENGAGKSTLMKIVSGFIQADAGQILLDGKPVMIHSPADSIRHGVGMLHQDPLDFPPMVVLDNFLTGSPQEVGKASLGLFPDRSKVRAELAALEKQFDFDLDPERHVDELTVGERQQLEILRLLWLGARVLILDEPTTGISALQKDKLFETLRVLASQGKTVIFVSHKLEDVEKLCSRVAVLRRGRLVGEAVPPYDIESLVTLMFGKSINLGSRQDCRGVDTTALELRQVTVEDFRTRVGPVDVCVCQGEVIGLAGMEGSGQRRFLRACAGLVRPVAGRILLNGKDLTGRGYHAFQRNGATYLPASRLEEGLIPGLSFSEHVVLSEEQDGLFIDWNQAHKLAQNRIQDFNIRGTPGSTVESLSGGNQQRALLALMRTPLSLVLMEHPTRGLDVESSIYIWSKLKERCRQGTGIVFISADLDEILLYSDRILVFFAGRVSSPLDASQTTVDQLGQLIGGKGW
jgi:simple sugar transport system ATP-binding protein